MALGDIHLDITWQAWHNRISMMPRDFAWQAWHLVTSTLISRGTVFVFASFVLLACLVYVLFQHVGWSLRHGLISDMFSAFSDMFSTSLVYACAVYGRSGMLFLSFSACLSSGMFLLSACFGMFDFGMFKYFFLSACCIPHTHLRPGAGLARVRYDRQSPIALHVFYFACLRMSCLWSLWHVVFTYMFSACLLFSACLSSGMCLLSACFGMFDFGMFKYFLLSACCIPHTHLRPGAGLARGRQAGPNCA